MSRLSHAVLLILVVGFASAAYVKADGELALAREVIELQRRVGTLERLVITPSAAPIFGATGELLVDGIPARTIIPADPELSLDMLCSIQPAIEATTGDRRIDLDNLHCVRYLRYDPASR
jgi:hypothetical protein